LNLKVQT